MRQGQDAPQDVPLLWILQRQSCYSTKDPLLRQGFGGQEKKVKT